MMQLYDVGCSYMMYMMLYVKCKRSKCINTLTREALFVFLITIPMPAYSATKEHWLHSHGLHESTAHCTLYTAHCMAVDFTSLDLSTCSHTKTNLTRFDQYKVTVVSLTAASYARRRSISMLRTTMQCNAVIKMKTKKAQPSSIVAAFSSHSSRAHI